MQYMDMKFNSMHLKTKLEIVVSFGPKFWIQHSLKLDPNDCEKKNVHKEIKSFFLYSDLLASNIYIYIKKKYFISRYQSLQFITNIIQINNFCLTIHHSNTKSHYKNEFHSDIFCRVFDSFLCWNFCSEELRFFLESWIFFFFMSIHWRCPLHYYYHLFLYIHGTYYLFERIECSIATICFFDRKCTLDGVLHVK